MRILDMIGHNAVVEDGRLPTHEDIHIGYKGVDCMKLNRVEKFIMNHPLRVPFLERYYRGRWFRQLGGELDGKKVLEIGCGGGVWTETMLRYFAVKEVHAFDLDPDLVERARRRLQQYIPHNLLLTVGDATSILEPDASFDLVVDTAVLHHVEDWRSAVREIRRVLRPGGFFYFEEVTRKGLQGWFNSTFLEHPKEDRFSTGEFISELEKNGIWVGNNFRERFKGGYFLGGGILMENRS